MAQEERTRRDGNSSKFREDRGRRSREQEESEFKEEVIFLNRVAKVVKGGRKFGFSALVAVGDLNGRVGLGIGKASEVLDAIRKGVDLAKKNLITVPREGTTIPYEIRESFCATTILLKPAKEGTGVIAGGPARTILKLAGIADVSAKYFGSNNRINCAKVAFNALQSLKPRKVLQGRRRTGTVVSISDDKPIIKNEDKPIVLPLALTPIPDESLITKLSVTEIEHDVASEAAGAEE
jgi:small subunit ribosomal protein S5